MLHFDTWSFEEPNVKVDKNLRTKRRRREGYNDNSIEKNIVIILISGDDNSINKNRIMMLSDNSIHISEIEKIII